jgi:hypothetical protein
MSSNGKKPYLGSKHSTLPQPGDEQTGEWTRERMDERFRERMLRAIERGLERLPVQEERAA